MIQRSLYQIFRPHSPSRNRPPAVPSSCAGTAVTPPLLPLYTMATKAWQGKDAKNQQLEMRGNGTFSNTWQIEMQSALCHDPLCESPSALAPFRILHLHLPRPFTMMHAVNHHGCVAAHPPLAVCPQTASAAASSCARSASLRHYLFTPIPRSSAAQYLPRPAASS